MPPLPRLFDNGNVLGSRTQNVRPVSVHPMPSADVDQPKEVSLVLFELILFVSRTIM